MICISFLKSVLYPSIFHISLQHIIIDMKVLKSAQVREVDEYTIKNEPVASIDLMERAAIACTRWLTERFHQGRSFKVYTGPGNNGGDGLAIARLLAGQGYRVELQQVMISDQLSTDSQINLKRLQDQNKIKILEVKSLEDLVQPEPEDIILDGIFGSGLSRPVEGFAAEVIHQINHSSCEIVSIDIPSGLFGEDNSGNNMDNVVKAKHTLTFQLPKLAFFFPENAGYTGEWHILNIGLHEEAISRLETDYYFTLAGDTYKLIRPRNQFDHKGVFGHALLVAGSYGKMGASVLSSRACLRTGVGLLTTHIPICGYQIMQTTVPEAMISLDKSEYIFTAVDTSPGYDAVGAGPGLGKEDAVQNGLAELTGNLKAPMVLDADALNILSDNKAWLNNLPPDSILTPHIKEFERLAGPWKNSFERLALQKEFASKYKVVLVVKGAYTSITHWNGKTYFNSTGNPGMASAGSGDVLTGIILSLLAQKYPSLDAAILGVFIHGLAGDFAMQQMGEEAMIASDIINNIGRAFQNLKG